MSMGEENNFLQKLSYEKSSGRRALESQGTISYLKRQDLWLESDFIAVLNRLVSRTEQITNVLNDWELEIDGKKDYNNMDYIFNFQLIADEVDIKQELNELNNLLTRKKSVKTLIESGTDDFDEEYLNEIGDEIEEAAREINARVTAELHEISDQIDEELRTFNESIEGEDLDILVDKRLYTCPKCGQLMDKDTLEAEECFCGEEIGSIHDSDSFSLRVLHAGVLELVNDNVYLEFAVERFFEKLGSFRAESGIHVLGSSGVKHELDTVAENREEGYRIFCECKTTDIDLNEVMKFNQKANDIGAVYKVFVATGETSDKSVDRFARNHNILLVENFWSALDNLEHSLENYLFTEKL